MKMTRRRRHTVWTVNGLAPNGKTAICGYCDKAVFLIRPTFGREYWRHR